jgi:NADH-quinone oxidoreductase subunit J
LTTYLLPFELASLLLLVAAVGAVVLARRRRGLEGNDDDFDPRLITARSLLTGTMAESTGLRGGFATEPDTESAGTSPDKSQGGW